MREGMRRGFLFALGMTALGLALGAWPDWGETQPRPMPLPMSERAGSLPGTMTNTGEDAACAAQLEEAFTLIQALTRRLVANGGSRILAERQAQQAIQDMLRMRPGQAQPPTPREGGVNDDPRGDAPSAQ